MAGLVGGGYYLTKKTAPTTAVGAAATGQSNPASRFGGRGGFGGGNRPTFGTVSAVNGTNFTVTENNGSTVNVQTTSSTEYGRAGDPSASQTVSVGETVAVVGSAGSSGVIEATRVLINPTFSGGRFGGGGGGGSGAGSPSLPPSTTN